MNIIKAIKTVGAVAIFFVAAFIAPHEADARTTDEFTIPVIGKTDDGKYSRFDLEGDLEDIKWFTNTTNYVYTSGDLLVRLPFIKKEDIDKGTYVCKFVCKDKEGYIVGQPESNRVYLKMRNKAP
jgi:hypothetical protein